MNAKQAIAVLEAAFDVKFNPKRDWLSSGGPNLASALYRCGKDHNEKAPEGLKITSVSQTGGNEGEGEHYDEVLKVKVRGGETFFVKIVGTFNSYEGVEFYFDNTIIVEPYEKTITDYRPIA